MLYEKKQPDHTDSAPEQPAEALQAVEDEAFCSPEFSAGCITCDD